MTSSPIPLAALGRLNAHARAEKSYGQAAAIYDYKELAALTLALDGRATLRLVRWQGKCSMCTNGRFTHWSWDDGYSVRCRDCGGTGVRTLRFTETTLPDAQVWHHPWNGRSMPGWTMARAALRIEIADDGEYRTPDGGAVEWHDATEWRPLLPGQKLNLEELVACLNDVEDWVESATCNGHIALRWPLEHARAHLHQRKHRRIIGENSRSYRLDLGRAAGGCFVCGDEQDLDGIRFGRMTPLFHWSLPVCKAHRNSPHPNDPPPEAMMTPAIRRWLDRHERAVEVA